MEDLRPLSYAFNQENVKKFIGAIQDEEAKKTIRILLNNTKYVSYDDFVEQIKINIPQILEIVPQGRPIFIYIDNNKYDNLDQKSNYWVSKIFKSLIPSNTVKYISSLDNNTVKDNDLVLLMDDCVYSGIQFQNTINELQNTFHKKIHLLLFVPYVSKAGMELIYNAFQKNASLNVCSFHELHHSKMIVPFGCYITQKQATNLSKFYPHLRSEKNSGKDRILEAYPVYFDHKVAKMVSSFPTIYSGLVPNKQNADKISKLLNLQDEHDLYSFFQYAQQQGENIPYSPDDLKDNINDLDLQIKNLKNSKNYQIIPILKNCENNINLDLKESSCPVPPYKKNSVKSKSIISSRTFKSLPLMKTLKDSLKRLSV
jgi:hypothetical protein